MFRSYQRFFRLVFKTFFHGHGTYARLTPKRFFTMSGVILLLFLNQSMHWVGFFLDELFFPQYRNVKVKTPVFIAGIPRSGTTLFHRTIARDTEHFTCITLWEMILAPSITEWKFWTAIGKLDKFLGSFGYKALKIIDKRFFREMSKIHATSLFKHEEDELLFLPILASAALIFPFPFPDDLLSFIRFDEEIGEEEQNNIMDFYKSCIQRHLYVHGQEKIYLAKNNFSMTKLKAFQRRFPDARFICIVRSPYNSIPSMMSLALFYWKQFHNSGDITELRDLLITMVHYTYSYPMKVLPEWPEEKCAFVRYEDLKNDLKGTVVDLYTRLSLKIEPNFAAQLEDEHMRSKGFKSKHVYSMEEYALTPDLILDSFRDVFEYFDFPTEYEMRDSETVSSTDEERTL